MHDVREILLMAKADAPPARYGVEDIVAAGRRRSRRAFVQRVGGVGVLAAAVATTAVLSAVNLVVPINHGVSTAVSAASPPAPTTPAPSPPFTFTFGGYQVGEYRVLAPDEVNQTYQTAGVLRDRKDARGKVTTLYVGTLTVYQPTTFDPAKFRVSTPMTVQGRDAFQYETQQPVGGWSVGGRAIGVPSDGPSISFTVTTNALAWQYAHDSWAVLSTEANPIGAVFPLADAIEVAERFTVAPTDPVPANVPFRTGYLPAGFTLQSVSGQSLTAENRGMVTFVYAQPGTTAVSVTISILWVDTPPPDAVKRTSRCNPGQHWCATTLPGGKFWVAVEDPSQTLSDEELLKVSDDLTFATLEDPGTWYPVS